MATFNTISTALVSLIGAIPGIKAVLDYPTVKFTGYPAAAIFLSGNENEYLDSSHNFVSYRFTIRIVDQMKTDPGATEDRMRAVADLVLAALDDSDDLSGGVEFLEPASIQGGFQKSDAGEYRVFLIDVVAKASRVI